VTVVVWDRVTVVPSGRVCVTVPLLSVDVVSVVEFVEVVAEAAGAGVVVTVVDVVPFPLSVVVEEDVIAGVSVVAVVLVLEVVLQPAAKTSAAAARPVNIICVALIVNVLLRSFALL